MRPLLGVVCAAVALLAGCERIEAFMNPPPKTPPAPPPVEVVAAPVERREVERFGQWVGLVDGSVNAEIRARVNGHLMRQTYEEGAVVEPGQLLFEIDPRPFEAQLASARADLLKVRAEQAASATEVRRLGPLVEKRAVSEQEYDDAVAKNEANLARIAAGEAAVEIAELNLDFTKVRAPIGGVAGRATVQIGDLVDPLSAALTTISTLDPANVSFFVTEREYLAAADRLVLVRDVPLADRPENFEIALVDGSVFPRKARYFFTDRQVEAGTGSLRVALRVDNPGNLLRPGQFAVVRTVIRTIPDAIVVPQRAVREVQGSYEVAVVKADSTIEIRQVVPGIRDGSDWVIEKGLAGDERIVVEGLQRVRTGTKVSTKAASPAAATTTPAEPQSR